MQFKKLFLYTVITLFQIHIVHGMQQRNSALEAALATGATAASAYSCVICFKYCLHAHACKNPLMAVAGAGGTFLFGAWTGVYGCHDITYYHRAVYKE